LVLFRTIIFIVNSSKALQPNDKVDGKEKNEELANLA
jgi:hypothetical protein